MKFVPYFQLDGIPNVVVDGNAHKDSKLVLSHWIDSGTDQKLMRDTSAQIVLDFLRNGHRVPFGVEAVSNDHFDQDGLVGIFALIHPEFALKHYDFLVDIATSGDFGKYKNREAARVSMALARMVHPSSGMIEAGVFQRPYSEMAATFYQMGIEMFPQFIENIDGFKYLWENEDIFLTACENNIKAGNIKIEEISKYDLAVINIPASLPESEFHRFTVIRKGSLHDMALHNSTKMSRILYSYGARLHFRYRYETWVQLEDNHHPLRVKLDGVAENLSDRDSSKWKYQGSNKLVPLLERIDKRATKVSLEDFKSILIEAFETENIDWDPYRKP